MAKKIFEVEYDDDLHFADDKGKPGRKRALLYDDDNNLRAHADLREVDEDELRERYSEPSPEVDDYDDDPEEYEGGLTPMQEELVKAVGDALAQLAIEVIEDVTPYAEEWWHKSAWPAIKGVPGMISGAIGGLMGSGRKEVLPAEPEKPTQGLEAEFLEGHPAMVSETLDKAYRDYKEDMSSDEAQRELLEIAVLASLLAGKVRRLQNANIVDGQEGQLVWSETVDRLTSENLVDGVNRILSGEAKPLDDGQLADFERLLGRSLYHEGSYIPITTSELRKGIEGNGGPLAQPARTE
jgi:hypothetical protein